MKKMISRSFFASLAISCVVLGALAVSAQQSSTVGIVPSGNPETPAEIRKQTFEIVWKTINEKHFDPNFNGVDWNAVHAKYAPLVDGVKTDDDLYALLGKMLRELKESHFAIIPPAAVIAEGSKGEPGDLGVDVRQINNDLVITSVTAKSSAEQAGLRPGYVVTSIDGQSISELRDKIALRKEHAQMTKFLLMRVAMGLMSGPVGSPSKILFIDGEGQQKEVSVEHQHLRGEPAKFGNLPTEYVEFDAHKLQNGIGYIQFNIFLMPVLAPFQAAMKEFKDAPGIVIDLRGNPGGIGMLSSAMARTMLRKDALLGTMKMRQGETKFFVNPDPNAYQGTVVILTDEASASTSEVMAGGLQELHRVVIVGQTSTGAVLPSFIEKLPNGAMLQFAIADFKTPKGVLLEGVGVHPDYDVPLTRKGLLAGHDEILDKAVAVIQERNKNK